MTDEDSITVPADEMDPATVRMMKRVQGSSATNNPLLAAVPQHVLRRGRAATAAYMARMHSEVRLPRVDGPLDLPALRRRTLADWQPDGAFGRLATYQPDARWVRQALSTAALWWVEPETCHLLAEAAPSWPDDHLFDWSDAPTPAGLAVFAEDLTGIDADPTLTSDVRLSALMWGPATLGPEQPGGQPRASMAIAAWSRAHLQEGLTRDDLQRFMGHLQILASQHGGGVFTGTVFAYLGHTDWLPGTATTHLLPDRPNRSDVAAQSMIEDRRLLATLWQLTRTPIVHVAPARVPRQQRRQLERKGLDPTVRVMRLGGEHVSRETPAEPRTVDWQHSWIVRPHWRWQAHGKGRAERKLILVGPYRKGPDDKPLIGADRVWRVVPPIGGAQ